MGVLKKLKDKLLKKENEKKALVTLSRVFSILGEKIESDYLDGCVDDVSWVLKDGYNENRDLYFWKIDGDLNGRCVIDLFCEDKIIIRFAVEWSNDMDLLSFCTVSNRDISGMNSPNSNSVFPSGTLGTKVFNIDFTSERNVTISELLYSLDLLKDPNNIPDKSVLRDCVISNFGSIVPESRLRK